MGALAASELAWQVVKLLLGAAVVWAVVVWDMREGEQGCGAITLAGAVAAVLGELAGVVDKGLAALWLGRLGLALLMLSVIQWLRLRDRERCADS